MALLKSPFGKANVESAAVPVPTGERVRVGLTGLAAIFLLILVVAAGVRTTPAPKTMSNEAPGESLAVLGVAPGAGSGATAPNPPPPPPRPSRT
ncbi:MAG: hypothetical protein RL490_79 [Pseudomonadota bacterium]|jgi:hypothetical protein